jgi:hypothetical protein
MGGHLFTSHTGGTMTKTSRSWQPDKNLPSTQHVHVSTSQFKSIWLISEKLSCRVALDDDETTEALITCIFPSMKQSLAEDNVTRTFVRFLLPDDTARIPYLLVFNENVPLQVVGFTSLWNDDYPPKNLSIKRSNVAFD